MAATKELDFIHKGLRCIVLFTDMGHRCGYVGIDKTHPLYEVGYDDVIPDSLKKRLNTIYNEPIGKRGILSVFCHDPEKPKVEILFDVHGGITYSGVGIDKESKLWFFGFDCAHCDDATDVVTMYKYGYGTSRVLNLDGEVRTKEYVRQECELLAEQLSSIIEEKENNNVT